MLEGLEGLVEWPDRELLSFSVFVVLGKSFPAVRFCRGGLSARRTSSSPRRIVLRLRLLPFFGKIDAGQWPRTIFPLSLRDSCGSERLRSDLR
jgi:hypothetical protein